MRETMPSDVINAVCAGPADPTLCERVLKLSIVLLVALPLMLGQQCVPLTPPPAESGSDPASNPTPTATPPPLAQALKPAIAPAGGDFTGSVRVAIACDTPGTIIRYTTDGTDPTAGNGGGESVSSASASARPQPLRWRVVVYTGDREDAGTDANVYLMIYGTQATCGEYPLYSSGDPFERGQADTFYVDLPDLGSIYTIRIRHDNSNDYSGWFLDKVVLYATDGSHTKTFPCYRWLATDEDDGAICRILYAQ